MLITRKPSTVTWEMLYSNERRPDISEAVTMVGMAGLIRFRSIRGHPQGWGRGPRPNPSKPHTGHREVEQILRREPQCLPH